jgi:hypothetical protein
VERVAGRQEERKKGGKEGGGGGERVREMKRRMQGRGK